MTEKKMTVAAKKKVYKAPAPVKTVESRKLTSLSCISCGTQVGSQSSPCGRS